MSSSASLLDETVTWAEFARRHLDPRVGKALTMTLGLERPTLVQSRGIPVALEGKDLLCRARTGSGKTLCYGVPMVQRLLVDAGAKGTAGPLGGLVLVPTKELVVQVHGVLTQLLAFCFDVLTVEPLLSGQKYGKAELPSILVTTPSALLALAQQRRGSMPLLSELLKVLVVDEADLMFSFGYEEDMRALCVLLPATYQAVLVSATLSEEVEQLKGLMLHKPVILKLEEPRVTGKLSQFYFVCKNGDKYLILYTLLKLQLLQGKKLMFVKNIDSAYKMKIFLERFSINSAVLNAELPHATRQNIIQAFNQSVVDLLIATDAGMADNELRDEGERDGDEQAASEEEAPEEAVPVAGKGPRKKRPQEAEPEADAAEAVKKKKKAKKSANAVADVDVAEAPVAEVAKEPKKKKKKKKAGTAEEEPAEGEEGAGVEVEGIDDGAPRVTAETETELITKQKRRRFGTRAKPEADEHYSLTRGVDLSGVSTVINADIPLKVRDYVHRVGRCARGGASGTAFTICTEEQQPVLEKIVRSQEGTPSQLLPLPLQVSDAERFRYRVEDQMKGLTKRVVLKYLARELQLEALNCERLQEYFEEHPEEKRALQLRQRELKVRKSIRRNLATVPAYLVPEELTAPTPVQQAVRRDQASHGLPTVQVRRKKLSQAMRRDPLHGFAPGPHTKPGSKRYVTREHQVEKDRRLLAVNANMEALPAISGRKIWKLRHGKRVRRACDQMGERRSKTKFELSRRKKFGF